MLNNPLGTIDPNGEEGITLAAAMTITIVVTAVTYTASVAMSDGGFDNWDWGDFHKSIAIAVGSSVVTWGVGQLYVGAVVTTTSQEVMLAVHQASMHAAVQGTIAEFTGGDPGMAMLSGFVGSLVGSYGTAHNWGGAQTIGASMLMGGASAEMQGGNFWKGAAIGGIVAGANHVAHEIGANPEERIQQNKERKQSGGDDPPSGGEEWTQADSDRLYAELERLYGNKVIAGTPGPLMDLVSGAGVAKAGYSVYKAVAKNGKVYWGMTKNFRQRVISHGDRFLSIVEVHTGIPTKAAARGVEQIMMDSSKGLKHLENSINSIGKNNLNLMKYYQEAVKYFNNL